MRLFGILVLIGGLLGAGPSQVTAQELTLKPVATGLDAPVGLAHAGDGSGRLFILEQEGRVLVLRPGSAPEVFLDIREQVNCCGEQGLLGIAFHPGFAGNGQFFLNYVNSSSETIIARYRAAPAENRAERSSEEVLLRIPQPYSNHNGGHLAFGPDGYLYIALGDGGGSGDPGNRAQDPFSLLGKLLRIDVNSASGYSIPPDNPFADGRNGRPEVWALGLRNPFRFSFDRATGRLYIADVGEQRFEEINVQPTGAPGARNYGWRRMEGTACFDPSDNCHRPDLTLPAFQYGHGDDRCSITGGYVYRGQALDWLRGSYIFGDFCSGEIAAARPGRHWEVTRLMDTDLMIASFGEDEAGEVYLVSLDGAVYRLATPLSLSSMHSVITENGTRSSAEILLGAATRGPRACPDVYLTGEALTVDAELLPQSSHVGRSASLYVAAWWQPPDGDGRWFYQNQEGGFRHWDRRLESLPAARQSAALASREEYRVYAGTLRSGRYRVYIGYRAAGASLVYNASPLEIRVGERCSGN